MLNVKFILYIFVAIIVIWSMDSININNIFKKNHTKQAKVFYFLLCLVMTYLITNFIFDFFFSTQIL